MMNSTLRRQLSLVVLLLGRDATRKAYVQPESPRHPDKETSYKTYNIYIIQITYRSLICNNGYSNKNKSNNKSELREDTSAPAHIARARRVKSVREEKPVSGSTKRRTRGL